MNEWVWSIGGMVLTGETEVLGEKHYIVWVVGEWMGMEHWWNDTDRGKLNYLEWCPSRCHFGGREKPLLYIFLNFQKWYWISFDITQLETRNTLNFAAVRPSDVVLFSVTWVDGVSRRRLSTVHGSSTVQNTDRSGSAGKILAFIQDLLFTSQTKEQVLFRLLICSRPTFGSLF